MLNEKKFLFVNFSLGVRTTGVNHGIAYLVPILKKFSYDVSLLNITSENALKNFMEKVKSFKPTLVGFSLTSNQLKHLLLYSSALASEPEIIQIAGGPHPTLDPENTLKQSHQRNLYR